ncbi:hypothetical protein GA0070616_4595 [Micromonospora nigra]|uniref:Uncharacterized protein n=1 Tax=Micromonospora nigra TaxID=145857 RepID=A0A1C6SUC4_9ACTN|nr:hypothetical protein [Micromonospora nigra]SCL32942.1 hypothetical protein GA0070616_4595 [Micromonospora nigra]
MMAGNLPNVDVTDVVESLAISADGTYDDEMDAWWSVSHDGTALVAKLTKGGRTRHFRGEFVEVEGAS